MLFAARSAAALHRLLDVFPVFAGDDRVERCFTLVPGSDFAVDALAALDGTGARTVPWSEALTTSYHLVIAASPKGELDRLDGPIVLLPHGAGYNKTVEGDGAPEAASGLDPAFLLRDGRPLAAVHALAHPGQRDRLAAHCPSAAETAVVVGDPTLDRLLESGTLRESYRAALRTGDRRLIVLSTTWGPWSLLAARPELPAALAAELPVDSYQLALVAHPNTHSAPGALNLAERLPPGVHLARPYEEWASLLVAADAVITDHGSSALYAAALGTPVLAGCDGGPELLPGTPMARLLAAAPRLTAPALLPDLLAACRPDALRTAVDDAFAERGHALTLLREALYDTLGLAPPDPPAEPRLLPLPRPRTHPSAAHAVRVRVSAGDEQDDEHTPDPTSGPAATPGARSPRATPGTPGTPGTHIDVQRLLPHTDLPSHHLAAEEDAAHVRHAQSAGLLYRRTAAGARHGAQTVPAHTGAGGFAAWTAAGWTAHALDTYPGCLTAAVILTVERCVVRRRGRAGLLTMRISPVHEDGRIHRPDPAAVLSGLHALLGTDGTAGDAVHPATLTFTCRVGARTYTVALAPASPKDAAAELVTQTHAPAHGTVYR